jgi:hypothetical protein
VLVVKVQINEPPTEVLRAVHLWLLRTGAILGPSSRVCHSSP